MSQTVSASVAGLLSLLLGLFVVYNEPARESLLQKSAEFGIVVPYLSVNPIVHDSVRDVKYVGSINSGVEHFQNIFYGEDTSGKNRFAPPVKFTPTSGSVVDATKAGAWCPQGTGDILPFTSKVTNISENCLSLRIARPRAVKPDAKLPVIVWMHGGGHALGSTYEKLYEPDGLVRQAAIDGQPVIFVGINYRLGIFGFAVTEALAKAGHTNAGLRDQRAAFEWVRDNIAAFGGDPNRITAIGQSVGASDIGLQLLAYGGRDPAPFQRAVMMSGGPNLNFNSAPSQVRSNTALIASRAGCIASPDSADSQTASTLACLRALPFENLTALAVSAARAARPPFGEAYFYPTIDGDILPARASELLREGKVSRGVPIVASWVANDGAWYAAPTTATDGEVVGSFGLWLDGLTAGTREGLLRLYPEADFEHMAARAEGKGVSAQYFRAAQMNKDIWFTCPVLDFTWQYVRNGGVGVGDVRIYEHNATRFGPAFDMMGTGMWGVAHLSDIPYVFQNPYVVDNSAPQIELGRLMGRSVVEYVNAGTPEGKKGGVEAWPPAFEGVRKEDLMAEFPKRVSLQVFGGVYGTRPVTVERDGKGELSDAERAIVWEKLFERCEFINSERFREESGV